jgi:hypothetical protein
VKKKRTFLSPEQMERHERIQRALLERIEFHEKRASERARESKPDQR